MVKDLTAASYVRFAESVDPFRQLRSGLKVCCQQTYHPPACCPRWHLAVGQTQKGLVPCPVMSPSQGKARPCA